jgi:SAM-dependent methyltransferase
MLTRPVTSDALARLRDERDQADRRYNEALTALDRSLPGAASLPIAPPGYDDQQLGALNERWQIVSGVTLPPPRGIRSRLARFFWRLIAPVFERQQAFNSTLVDHLNRNAAAERDARRADGGLIEALNAQAAAVTAFQSQLIQYLQQVTLYIDTKDRLAAGSLMAVYDAAINTLTDDLMRRAESMAARETRFDGRVSAVTATQDDVRARLATLQQATLTLKREVERLLTGGAVAAHESGDASSSPSAPVVDSYKYVGFEDRFRGSQDDIRARLEPYVAMFHDARDVLDVGCGRGEFLDLLRADGTPARGLDLNHEMVEVCRERGLDVAEGDLVSYLSGLPDAALGGLIAIQVVEHLEPAYLLRALDLAYHKLRPGSRIVLETINPACWFAFFASYIRDLTHVRPIHPETLQYLLTASGFEKATIEWRSPYPSADKLQPVARGADDDPPAVKDLRDTINTNVERLNGLLFTYMDYAAVGIRP